MSLFIGRSKSKNAFLSALALLFILSLPIIFFSFSFYYQNKHDRIFVISLLFVDIIPFMISLIWFARQYKHSGSNIDKFVLDVLSFVFVCGFPLLAYWQSRYADHDEKGLPPTLLLILDVFPFLFGVLWYAHRLPKASRFLSEKRIYFMPFCLILGLVLACLKIFSAKK